MAAFNRGKDFTRLPGGVIAMIGGLRRRATVKIRM
ncbi:hypothetical protein X757_31185 [Mesorhizobium sp. LSHC414A00]|nr:hypothetical protein X757_31185 [Mesorhizobium sp. LSHC414A00]ESZ55949.1 hypothetical protein X729_25200 [Mesorhizobium sp. L103C131B0]